MLISRLKVELNLRFRANSINYFQSIDLQPVVWPGRCMESASRW